MRNHRNQKSAAILLMLPIVRQTSPHVVLVIKRSTASRGLLQFSLDGGTNKIIFP